MGAVRQYRDVVVRYLDVVGVYLYARAGDVSVGGVKSNLSRAKGAPPAL